MNKFFNCALKRGLAQIQSAFDIRFNVALGSTIRIRNRNQSGEMEQDIYIFRQRQTEMTVSNISGHHLNLVQQPNVLEPAPEVERIILSQGRYMRSCAQQMFDQM